MLIEYLRRIQIHLVNWEIYTPNPMKVVQKEIFSFFFVIFLCNTCTYYCMFLFTTNKLLLANSFFKYFMSQNVLWVGDTVSLPT